MILGSHIHEAQSIAPAKEYSGQDDLVMWIDMKDSPVGFDSSDSIDWKIVNKVDERQYFNCTSGVRGHYSHLKDRRALMSNCKVGGYSYIDLDTSQLFRIRNESELQKLCDAASTCIGTIEMCGRFLFKSSYPFYMFSYGAATRAFSAAYASNSKLTLRAFSRNLFSIENIPNSAVIDFYFCSTRDAKDNGTIKGWRSFNGGEFTTSSIVSSLVPYVKNGTSGSLYAPVIFGSSMITTSTSSSKILDGNMAYAYRWYNRVLTDEEILHNYNVDRIKYRLGMMD